MDNHLAVAGKLGTRRMGWHPRAASEENEVASLYLLVTADETDRRCVLEEPSPQLDTVAFRGMSNNHIQGGFIHKVSFALLGERTRWPT